MIAIVDCGIGNLRSLHHALEYNGLDAEVLADATRLIEFSHVILPGVGAFGKAMHALRERGFVEPLRAHAASRKPLLGICLGMQLLATASLEFGEHGGLGLVPGTVIPFEASVRFPVPHVGWNDIGVLRRHPIFSAVKKSVDYYFVHSFHFESSDRADIIATCDYGRPFNAVVGRGSVVGTQFHPEKSQAGGLALLEGFAAWDGAC